MVSATDFPDELIGSVGIHHSKISKFHDLNTTTVNQVLGLPGLFSTFSGPQLRKLRIIAICASVASIFACIIGLYLLASIDKRRKVFRHHLILFLLICDFLKAIVLLIYPIVIINHKKIYGYPAFYNTVGWLTAYAIEGADIAIFIFAIHFAILIFKPNWKWKNSRTGNMEGGFYKWRKFMYPFTALTPTILASLAFINLRKYNQYVIDADSNPIIDNNNYNFTFQARVGGYKPLSAWCYLPPYPIWYKLALSWGPRYFILLTICTLYISIYIFVTSEGRKIKSEIKAFQHSKKRPPKLVYDRRSANGDLQYIHGLGRMVKYYFSRTLSAIGSFFFLQAFDDTSSDENELTTAKSTRRAGTPGMPLADDVGSDLSSWFDFSPDDVDIEDGYNSDTNNGVHLFNYNNSEDLKRSNRDVLESGPILENGNFVTKPGKAQTRQSFFHSSSKPHDSNRLCSSSSPHDTSNLNKQNDNVGLPDKDRHRSFSPVHREQLRDHDNDQDNRNHVSQNDVTGIKHNFQSEMYTHFKSRRDQIRRQLKSIFIYPVAYLLLWVFPFIVDCSQYSYEIYHGPIVWLAYIATFMQPLNGVVDVAVFMFRELPWRYSWASIQSRELVSKYRLKGEIGEQAIMKMCESKLGQRGWYFRGRWMKEECWKHKPQFWKRYLWYAYRFMIGFFKNNYDFEDHCLDRDYWDAYYGNRTSKAATDFSTGKQSPVHNNSLPSSVESSEASSDPYARKFKIPILWRIVHFFPLQQGIDLDELDRYLRLKDKYDDFVIPGLQLAINNKLDNPNATSIFKPNYSLDGGGSSVMNESATNHTDSKSSSFVANTASKSFNFGNALNINFSDVTNNPLAQDVATSAEMTSRPSKDEELDLLSFLKG